VLGESSEPSMGLANHADRPEVVEALRTGTGQAVRWSATRDRRLLYAAAREERDGQQRVIRIAVPIHSITEHLLRLRAPVGLTLVTALTIGMLVAWLLSRTMRRRIDRMIRFAGALSAGTTGPPMGPEQADDLGLLERQLAEMSRGIDVTLGAVRLERERLEAVLRGMVEGVLVTDLDGRVVLLNDQARALLGLAPDARVTGRPLVELVRDPGIAEIPRRLATEDAVPSREVALLGDAARWLQVSAGRLTQEGGAPFGLVLVLHDISELRRLETVRQDFVANVSHELRTPLTAIRGYAETLLGPAGDERDTALRFLEIIDRHARRLGRLIDDLLALSDLEFGRTPLRRQACALGPAIDDVIQMLAEPAAQGGLSVTSTVAPGTPLAWVDGDRLRQVLTNLLDNALKYTPAGGRVHVDAGPATLEGAPAIELRVSDTGIGVPSQDLPRLTERFFRVDKARSRELGGTGLGLAIVKHIVQAHGGRLAIESTFGQGTTVHVTLPAAPDPDAPAGAA